MFLGVAGGTIERSCYSPHYVNTERDYERDYQATLPQGRTAADGCKPRHGRDDRKRERSFSGLSRVGENFSTSKEGGIHDRFLAIGSSKFFLVFRLDPSDFEKRLQLQSPMTALSGPLSPTPLGAPSAEVSDEAMAM